MASSDDQDRLNTSAWERLQDLAERLEALWREQGPVDLNALLPPPGDPARLICLVELINTDLEIRWRRGQGVRLDWYVERFEELGAISELPPRLIYAEYRVRQEYGDKPDLSSYQRRFPGQFEAVQRLIEAEPIDHIGPARGKVITVPEGYRLIERIGTGSFGEVWRAEAPGGLHVALKNIYRPVGSHADQHEKKAIDRLKKLSHPFLLSTHAYWIASDGRLHVAMELADGTLRDRLKECLKRGLPGIPPDELLEHMKQSAQALDYVHGEGLYHRDIKPDNILIKKGFAKVGDFSLVRNQKTLSIDSAVAGTLAYMGPECFRGNVVKQSDQYSLAVTYFELRTNRRPFPPRTNWYDAMVDALEGTPDLTPLEGPELAVLVKALAKKPEDRFPSCIAFVEALETALKGEPALLALVGQESWLQSMRRVGPDGYQLLHRLSGSSAVGQFWEAVAPGGKHVALQVIENLDRGGVLKHLRAYDLARCLAGAANVLQVHENWLANAAGEVRSLADVLKTETEERVALMVVQELADDDLARRLGGSRRKLSEERLGQLLTYLKQAALALDHINSRVHTYARRRVAIRHCAIRPENLLLIGDELRIAHFELAQEVTASSEPLRGDNLDLEPGYTAPELLEPRGHVTEASDQYSLAMTFVKLRTGALPFDQSQLRTRIIEEQLEGKLNLKALPERERAIIAKATARRPEDRFPSCAAMIAALEAVHRASLAEAFIEPPSVHDETLETKPETHRPPAFEKPTPAHGNWRVQGLGKAPAMEHTRGSRQEAVENEFEIHVPPMERAKRRVLRKQSSSPRGGIARGIIRGTLGVLVGGMASLGRLIRHGPSKPEARRTPETHTAAEPPSEIRRYSDVSFPAKAAAGKVHQLRMQLVPAEEVLPSGEVRPLPRPHAHDAAMSLKVPRPERAGEPPPPIRVMVSVAAENFTIEGPARAELVVPLHGPSAALGFRLRALRPGPGRIMVDFTQNGRPAGSVDLYPEVVNRRAWRGVVARLLLLAVLVLSGASCAAASTLASDGGGFFASDPLPWNLLAGVIVFGALALVWGLLRSTRYSGTARTEGEDLLALSARPLQPPDVMLKVFELRYSDQPGRLHFHLFSTHPALQDLPVMDGDLGTQDLKSDVAAWVESRLQTLGALARRTDATAEQVDTALADVGYQLFEQLLPEKLQALCWTFRQRGVQSMLVLSDEPHIPWELIKPYSQEATSGRLEKSDAFWGEAFALTHWLRGRPPVHQLALRRVFALAAGAGTSGPGSDIATRDMTLTADQSSPPRPVSPPPVRSALPSADEELALIRALEKDGACVQFLPARRQQLCKALEEGRFDLLHVACHGSFDSPTRADTAAVFMEDGAFTAAELSPRMAGALRAAAPLIVFNSCQSGRVGFALTRLGSWGARLVQLGCGGFVGALWPVTDLAALEFTRAFYGCLVQGAPLGTAMMEARQQVRRRYPQDPSWLAYRCFADPMARVCWGHGRSASPASSHGLGAASLPEGGHQATE